MDKIRKLLNCCILRSKTSLAILLNKKTISKRKRAKQYNNLTMTLGFSLTELLIVMTIIGVLASFTFVSFKNAQEKNRDARRKQDLRAIATALISYYGDNEAYPPPCSPCSSSFEVPSNSASPWIPNLSSYIQRLPIDPKQTGTSSGGCANIKNVYCYQAASDRKSFVLWAQLENTNDRERTGGSSPICNQTPPLGPLPDTTFNYCIQSPQ